MVKNPPAVWETWVLPLGWEDPLEEGMATHTSSHPVYYVPSTHCCCSVAKSCPTLCDPLDCSAPGSSVFRCTLEFAQVPVQWIMSLPHSYDWRSIPFDPLPLIPPPSHSASGSHTSISSGVSLGKLYVSENSPVPSSLYGLLVCSCSHNLLRPSGCLWC